MAYPVDYWDQAYYRKTFDTYEEGVAFCSTLPRPAVTDCIKGLQHKKADPNVLKNLETLAKVIAIAVATIVAVVLLFTIPWAMLFQIVLTILKTLFNIVKSVANLLKGVLDAIRFHELLAIHRAAYSLAPAYRELVNRVYSEISKVSEQLGLGAQFMNLALRNARAIVLSASSLIGRSYDMGELEWWTRFDGWTSKANERLTSYKEHPELVFEDIDEWLIRQGVTEGTEKQGGVLATVADTAQKAAQTVEDVKGVRDDLGKTIADLPADVQKYVRPVTDPILNKFDNFYYDTYQPAIGALGIEVEESGKREAVLLQRIEGIDLTIKTSTVRLKEWERLPPEERTEEEDHQEEISNRQYRRQSEEYETVVVEEDKRIEMIREERKITAVPAPPPEVLTYEPEKPAPLPPRLRWWDVGDY